MSTQHRYELDLCSECGEFVESLNSVTGWCDDCSLELGYIAPSCPVCGRETIDGKLCSRCKYDQWLERNADAIEVVMAITRVNVKTAKRIVTELNRPVCQSCGQPIKGGQKGRHYFCTKNPECVKGHNVYEYNLRHKPQIEALTLAITASRVYKLTAIISIR